MDPQELASETPDAERPPELKPDEPKGHKPGPGHPHLHDHQHHHVHLHEHGPIDSSYRLVIRTVLWVIAGALLVGFIIWWTQT